MRWEIRDGEFETMETEEKRKRSILVASISLMVGSIMFSVVLPSMALYMAFLEGWDSESTGSGSRLLYAFAVSAYSIGQFFGGPLAGFLCNRFGPKSPLIGLLSLFCLSSIWYSQAGSGWELIFTRFLIGFADGNITICRTFVTQATTSEERSTYMSRLGGCQAIGVALGFLLGGVCTPIDVFPDSRWFKIDAFTAPGYLSAIIGFLNILLVVFFFLPFGEPELEEEPTSTRALINEERYKTLEAKNEERERLLGSDKREQDKIFFGEARFSDLSVHRRVGVGLGIFVWFTLSCCFSLFETIQTPYMHDNYGWSPFEIGLVCFASFVIVIIQAFILPKFNKCIGEKRLLVIGLGGTAIFLFLLSYPWGHGAPPALYYVAVLGMFFKMYGTALISLSVLFSKILGGLSQGVYMGYLTSSGSIARMIGPIWTVELYRLNTTGTPLFLCASAVMIFGTVAGVCMPSIPRNNFLRSGSRDHENHSDSRG